MRAATAATASSRTARPLAMVASSMTSGGETRTADRPAPEHEHAAPEGLPLEGLGELRRGQLEGQHEAHAAAGLDDVLEALVHAAQGREALLAARGGVLDEAVLRAVGGWPGRPRRRPGCRRTSSHGRPGPRPP